jgi:hypothetical protein
MVELLKSTISVSHHSVALLFYVAKESISLNLHEKRMILHRISPLQGKPNSHAWNIEKTVPKQPAFHSGSWIRSTTNDCRTICTSNMQDVRLQRYCMTVLLVALQHVFPHVEASNRINQIRVVGGMSTCRADWLPGLPLTIFHGMWLVFSNA